MPITCIYHLKHKMRVVTFEESEKLLATGEWFDHPNEVKQKELKDEKPIRREPRKRSKHSECETGPNGI